MILQFIISFIIPVVLSLLVTPLVIKLAIYINAVDNPGGRKIHEKITPRIGGLGIFISIGLSLGIIYFLFPSLFDGLQNYQLQVFSITASLVIIFALGFWDDLKALKPGMKFGVQFLIASLVYFAGFKISIITNPLGSGFINVELIDFPLTLLWIVGVTNAFNLIDGLDGLASGVATIACVSIFSVSALGGELSAAIFALILAGALVGFLRYNFNPARIFLGDSGSLIIGFSLALMSIQSSNKISTGFALLFPMLVLGLPITDTIISMLRRFMGTFLSEQSSVESKSILGKLHKMFTPDRSHIHHQLIALGLTHRNTVILLYIVSACFALSAFAITQVNDFEKSISISLMACFAIFLGIKKLRYREISIFNNGVILPIYERWIVNKIFFLSLVDLTFIALSYFFSYYLVISINPEPVSHLNFEEILISVSSIQLFVFWVTGLYRETIKQMGIGNALKITNTVLYAVISSGLLLLLSSDFPLINGLQFLLMDFYLLLTFTLGFRMTYQTLSYWFHRDYDQGENILIYGANENGTMILHKINNSRQNNYKVLGFLDDDPKLEGKFLYGYRIWGGFWKLSKMLRSLNLHYIFICEEDIKPENLNRLIAFAESKDIQIRKLHIRLKNIENEHLDNKDSEDVINESIISYF